MSREWDRLSAAEQTIITGHQYDAPVRLSAIARALGVPIRAATLPAGISGEIRPDGGGFVIRVNRHDPEKRQRFTVAHELGHYLLHRDQIGSGIRDDVLYRSSLSDRREAEANRLAADILMPMPLVRQIIQDGKNLEIEDLVEYASNKLNVSEAAIQIRLGLS